MAQIFAAITLIKQTVPGTILTVPGTKLFLSLKNPGFHYDQLTLSILRFFYFHIFLLTSLPYCIGQTQLQYTPAPADNPLKGLVPYVSADSRNRFPHSMEFKYFSLRELMTGYDSFDWQPIENTLATSQKRGNQLILRVYLEYPGKPVSVPQFLIDDDLKITTWKNPDDGAISHTPDYESPVLRKALLNFITALGSKYDKDPRVGYITAGLLGSWGEWHNYPKTELWASNQTQGIVLDSFTKAFTNVPILLRYPAANDHPQYLQNSNRPFGYHDDSFAWSTIETKGKVDWYFVPLLQAAGATEKWKTQPIGGEIRPELWTKLFTKSPHPKEQNFSDCVNQTHVTWLMDSGLFSKQYPLSKSRKKAAIREVQKMGYEFHISSWRLSDGVISIEVENRGVAPFYRNWPVELFSGTKKVAEFDLRGILPGRTKSWSAQDLEGEVYKLRVPNPMTGGKSLRFANKEQGPEWLVLQE